MDTIAFKNIVLGADGWVMGLVCAFRAETVVMNELIKAGKILETLIISGWFMPLFESDIVPELVQNIKIDRGLHRYWN